MNSPDATLLDYPDLGGPQFENMIPGKIRLFDCSCGTILSCRPKRDGWMWHYRMRCPNCKRAASSLKKVGTWCKACKKVSYVCKSNPTGTCIYCKKNDKEKDPFESEKNTTL